MKAKQLTEKFVLNTYKRFPVEIEKAIGAEVWDFAGKKYVDFCSGVGVNSVGHCNPKVVAAIKKQAEKLMHCSNLYYSEPQAELAEKLIGLSGLSEAFFCNSGAESVEAALKLAKKHSGKSKIIAFEGSFHGRTMGALSATWAEKYRKPFEPLVPGIEFAKYGDLESVEEKIDLQTAAVIVEPVQGESGVIVPPKEFLPGLKKLCDENKSLLIVDEVQTGLCRTGKTFCFQHSKIEPDIVCVAKALGGGLPIGAMIAGRKVAESFGPGDHASTFGGNPVACAAGLAVLEFMEEERLAEKAGKMGNYALEKLQKIVQSGKAAEARGIGLMLGLELETKEECEKTVNNSIGKGALFCKAGEKTVRLLPPLVISKQQLDFGIGILEEELS